MRFLVVIPTYQEVANIEQVLRRTRSVAPEAEMLVVDDGSPDGTAAAAEVLAEELGGIHVLRRTEKAGLGAAYRAGFTWGLDRGFDVLVEMDADLSHDPAALRSLLEAIDGGADLVIGSRYVPGGSIPSWPWHRRALSRYGNVYARSALGLEVHDATAGFRAYRAAMLEELDISHFRSTGYTFQIESTYRVKQSGGRVREVPISFTDRLHGTSKMSTSIIFEAFALVTGWAIRDRVLQRGRRPKPRS